MQKGSEKKFGDSKNKAHLTIDKYIKCTFLIVIDLFINAKLLRYCLSDSVSKYLDMH